MYKRQVHDQLRDAGVKSRFLGKTEACEYVGGKYIAYTVFCSHN